MRQQIWIRISLLVLLLFAIFHLWALDRIPLVWFDEVMGLDPAVNAVFKEGYRSFIWPQAGTEQRFMAYLPIRFLFHMAHLQLLPFEPYWQRLPWALYYFTAAYLLYRSIRSQQITVLFALLLSMLFLMDRTVFEVARSMRVDPLSLLFLSASGLAYFRKQHAVQAVLASLLVFVHPNLWFASLALFLGACVRDNRQNGRTPWIPHLFWAIPMTFAIAYLFTIDWDIAGLYSQLFEHGSDHSASGGIVSRVVAHFHGRFWPYYLSQPYIPLLIYAALVLSVRKLLHRNGTTLDWALVLTHLYWLAILAPLHRYNAVLLLLSLLSLIPYLPALQERLKWGWVLAFLLIHPINSFARYGMAILQHQERDPQPVLAWIQHELTKGPSLISGSDVAYYAVGTSQLHDYCMFNLQPLKHRPESYAHCLLLLHLPQDTIGLGGVGRLRSEYRVEPNERLQRYSSRIASPTYQHMGLFELSAAEFRRITAIMDQRNRKINGGR